MANYIDVRQHEAFRGLKTTEELILGQLAGNGVKYLSIDNNGLVGFSDGLGQIQADWTQTNTAAVDFIKNKPTIPAAQVSSDWNASSGVAQILNKPTLALVATTGSYNDLSNKPSIPLPQQNSDWNAVSGVAQILNKPALATVATTGSYNDLSNKPSIPSPYVLPAASTSTLGGIKVGANLSIDVSGVLSAIVPAQQNSDWNAVSGVTQILNKPALATVATTGSYNDLSNKPSIPAAYTLPTASATILGGIKVGANLSIDGTGVLSATASSQVNSDWNAVSGVAQILNKPALATVATTGAYSDLSGLPAAYTLPTASATILGGIKIGANLSIDGAGVVSASASKYPTSLAFTGSSTKVLTITLSDSSTVSGSFTDLNGGGTSGGISTLNGLTDSSQGFATGTAGTDFTIASSAGVHTFNLPSASALNRGLLTTVDWSTFNGKQNALGTATGGKYLYQDQTWKAIAYSEITGTPTLATVATTGSYNDLSSKPTIPAAQVNSDWTAVSGVTQILNKPTFATVATSGSYNDLSSKPTIPAAQVNSDWTAVSGVTQILNKPTLATVATTGSYNDLSNKPSIPTYTFSNGLNGTTAIALGGALTGNTTFTGAFRLSQQDGTFSVGNSSPSSGARLHVETSTANSGSATGATIYALKSVDPSLSDLGVASYGDRIISASSFASNSIQSGMYGEIAFQSTSGFTFSGSSYTNFSGITGVYTMYNDTGSMNAGASMFSGGAFYSNLCGTGVVSKLAAIRLMYPIQTPSPRAAFTGSVTNYYGLYIDDYESCSLKGFLTNRWGIFQAGHNEKNRLYGTTTMAQPIRTINANTIVTADDCTLAADTSGGFVQVTIDPTIGKFVYWIMKYSSDVNAVAVVASSGSVFGISSTNVQGAMLRIHSDGTNLFVSK